MYCYAKAVFAALVLAFIVSCARPQGATTTEKRDFILRMKDDTLAELYKKEPESRAMVIGAPGYAVFSNVNTQLLFFGTGNGYGVVIDNSTGKKTYMKMGQAGVGLGVAIKDFRAVMIFTNKSVLREFVEKGWDFGGQAGAGAKSSEKGGGVSCAASADSDILIHQITKAGVELRTQIVGTKYWKDDELHLLKSLKLG
jgi:lipid-binding SYLF domain-containing protein